MKSFEGSKSHKDSKSMHTHTQIHIHKHKGKQRHQTAQHKKKHIESPHRYQRKTTQNTQKQIGLKMVVSICLKKRT